MPSREVLLTTLNSLNIPRIDREDPLLGWWAVLGLTLASMLAISCLIRRCENLLNTPKHIFPKDFKLQDVQTFLKNRDQREAPLKPKAASSVTWVNNQPQRTEFVLLFFHGWSTSPREVEPVDQRVASMLGANLVRIRLSGHGLESETLAGSQLMNAATREAMMRDAATGFALSKACGSRVILMGSSTGGTLALWLAAQSWAKPYISSLVLFSPGVSLAVYGAAYTLLKWPIAVLPTFLSKFVIHLVAGPKRHVKYISEQQREICTMEYPSESVVNICRLYLSLEVGTSASSIWAPILIFANPTDPIVSYSAMRKYVAKTNHTMVDILDSEEEHHITGEIHSPSTVDRVVAVSVRWLKAAHAAPAESLPLTSGAC